MPAESAIRITGLRELNAAFARADRKLNRELRSQLKAVAEPVREDAERRAKSEIRRITDRWARMRTGATRTVVYVAPAQRGTRDPARKRPNLAGLLLGRAMEPALQAHETEIQRGLELFLDEIATDWER